MRGQMITHRGRAAGQAWDGCPARATPGFRNGHSGGRIAGWASFWGFFLLLSGCTQPAWKPASEPAGSPCTRVGVVYKPAVLGRCLAVGDGEVRRETGSQRLQVRVPLVNTAPEKLKLRVRIQFLDRGGNAYDDETALRCVKIPAGEARWMRATSLRACACHYRVWVEWVAEKP